VLNRPARPIRTLHLDDLVLLVAKCTSGFTHSVIAKEESKWSDVGQALPAAAQRELGVHDQFHAERRLAVLGAQLG